MTSTTVIEDGKPGTRDRDACPVTRKQERGMVQGSVFECHKPAVYHFNAICLLSHHVVNELSSNILGGQIPS